jgi:hypothetical protein
LQGLNAERTWGLHRRVGFFRVVESQLVGVCSRKSVNVWRVVVGIATLRVVVGIARAWFRVQGFPSNAGACSWDGLLDLLSQNGCAQNDFLGRNGRTRHGVYAAKICPPGQAACLGLHGQRRLPSGVIISGVLHLGLMYEMLNCGWRELVIHQGTSCITGIWILCRPPGRVLLYSYSDCQQRRRFGEQECTCLGSQRVGADAAAELCVVPS